MVPAILTGFEKEDGGNLRPPVAMVAASIARAAASAVAIAVAI